MKRIFGAAVLSCSFVCFPAYSDNLAELLPNLLQEHDKILAEEASVKASKFDLKKEKAAWLPTVDLKANTGWEKRLNPGTTADTETGRDVEEVTVKQLLFDFGKTGAAVKNAENTYRSKKINLSNEQQKLILDGAKAFLDLMRAAETLRYATLSENNFKQQTGMEEARVKRGSGLSTDVLQTKSSLAGATAKTVSAQGSYNKAENTFLSVFKYKPDVNKFAKPPEPFHLLPKTVDEAVDIALENNLEIKTKAYDVQIAEQDIRAAKAKFTPKIDFTLKGALNHDDGGTFGTKEVYTAMFEANYPLYAGGGDYASLHSKREKLIKAKHDLNQKRIDITERVRNSWQDLETSRSNATHLRNQSNISGEFLDLARKERQLGTRSLLDVLNGETQYITALSSASEAEMKMLIDAYRVMNDIGLLDMSFFDPNQMPKSTKEAQDSKKG